jgi:Domain of unknown function (DUF4157)
MMAGQAQHAEQKHKEAAKNQFAKLLQQTPALEGEPVDLSALQRAVLDPGQATPGDILGLQRAAGNRATSRLIQTRLTVGAAGDRYEQEADRVAERVLTMTAPGPQQAVQRQEDEEEVQAKPVAADITPLAQRQEDEEEVQTKPLTIGTTSPVQRQEDEEEVQAKPAPGTDVERHADGSFGATPGMESRLAAGRGNGQPLSSEVRVFMEERFGADFGAVRVHTGREAAGLSHQIQAQAFTHGNDIYLDSGRYEPGTDAGKRLLAHELTHVVQQGKATAQRKTVGRIARRPTEAIQREGKLEALKQLPGKIGEGIKDYSIAGAYTAGQNLSSAARTTGGGISSAAKTVGGGISSAAQAAGSGIKDYTIAGAYTAGHHIGTAAKAVGGAISGAAKATGHAISSAARTVGSGIRDYTIAGAYTAGHHIGTAAKAVGGAIKGHLVDPLAAKIHGAYVGTRDVVEPLEEPKDVTNADEANEYAGKLMYRTDGHFMETQRNSRFMAEDAYALDHAFNVATEKLAKKKAALAAVQEPTGRLARFHKSASEQRTTLQNEVTGITKNLDELLEERTKAETRLTQAETSEAELDQASSSVRNTYITDVLPWKKNQETITPEKKATLRQLASTEKVSAGKRNDVSRVVNEVREAGRGERLLLNLTKLIGAKVVNFGLQTVTLGLVGVEAKDRPGGYSSTVKISTMMGKLRAEAKRLHAIGTSTLYKNTGLSKAYAALKGLSTLVILPLRTVVGSVGMLATGLGALVGLASAGFAAAVSAVCLQISTICTYIALGLTALNALINGALAVVNALRLQFAANRTKAAGLRAEYSETFQNSIMDVITAAATAGGMTASAGVVEAAHIEGYGFKDVMTGQYFDKVPTGVTVLKVGAKLGAGTAPDLTAQALTPVVFDKASPNTKLLVESTRKDLMKRGHLHESLASTMVPSPFSTEHRKIKGYVVGVPYPKFVTQVAPKAVKGAGTAIKGAGGSLADFTREEYEAARKKLGDSKLAQTFNKQVIPLTKKIFGVQNKVDWVSEKFKSIKKHFEKKPEQAESTQEHEDARELTDTGSNVGDLMKRLTGGTPDALAEGQAEVAQMENSTQ